VRVIFPHWLIALQTHSACKQVPQETVTFQRMKNNPSLTFFTGIALGLVAIAGYWMLQNPDPEPTPAVSTPAPLPVEIKKTFHEEPKLPDSITENREQNPLVTKKLVSPESSPEDRPEAVAANAAQVQQTSNEASTLVEAQLPPAQMPLAFRQLPPALAATNPQMADALKTLQQSFVDAIGGSNQNPADPAYYQRWVAAQTNIDEKYRILVGNQQFLIEQMQVNNQ